MKTTSKDGTSIAYERSGQGPALILVDGALCSRRFGMTSHQLQSSLQPVISTGVPAGSRVTTG